jgi:hypothetical protein
MRNILGEEENNYLGITHCQLLCYRIAQRVLLQFYRSNCEGVGGKRKSLEGQAQAAIRLSPISGFFDVRIRSVDVNNDFGLAKLHGYIYLVDRFLSEAEC